MVFPISDDNSDRTLTPVVNYVLIAINVLVFVLFQQLGDNDAFTYRFSTVPEEIRTGQDVGLIRVDPETGEEKEVPIEPTPISVYLTLLTSMFMHGSIMHILGNMWFLWIFGDNVENSLGHRRYIAFYLLAGLLASLAHVATNLTGPGARLPSLGASGAISGVMGAYVVLYPLRRVRVILFRIFTEVPAYVAVGIWFLFQLVSGLAVFGGEQSGIAYAAHIGGFAAGVILAKPFAYGRPVASLPSPPTWR